MLKTSNVSDVYDALEIHPVCYLKEHDCFEPCEPHEADQWSLYGHRSSGGLECIGDFATFEAAEAVRRRLEGMNRSAVLIEVSGGVAEVMATQGPAEALIIDWDIVKDSDQEYIRETLDSLRSFPVDPVVRNELVEHLSAHM